MKQSLDVKWNLFTNQMVVVIVAHDPKRNLTAFLTCTCPMRHLQGDSSISLLGWCQNNGWQRRVFNHVEAWYSSHSKSQSSDEVNYLHVDQGLNLTAWMKILYARTQVPCNYRKRRMKSLSLRYWESILYPFWFL
jgi:hypothetical protein